MAHAACHHRCPAPSQHHLLLVPASAAWGLLLVLLVHGNAHQLLVLAVAALTHVLFLSLLLLAALGRGKGIPAALQ